VRPSERIRDLKELSTRLRPDAERGSRHASAFKENIREGGVLNEFKLARQTYGLIDLIPNLPQGMRIQRKKPEVAKKPKPIEGLAEVQKLYELLDDPDNPPEGP
jgi:succinate dehydrogenase / fumarate reductase iron-sulfur subunit